ncbi:MAG: rhodanese-like domain-containing protein [Elusimicrobiota bacterium]|nr:rhodanese-like domain-containing protein [Elusimicrobiota bacterium]
MPQQATTKTQGMSAAEYFKAKLAYDMSPYGLHELIDQKSQEYQVVDVRSAADFAAGHIPTAINIPLADLPAKLSSLPKNKTIVTSCGSITCQLAPRAALELAQKGFKVMELHGGFREWTSYGFPVEKS